MNCGVLWLRLGLGLGFWVRDLGLNVFVIEEMGL